MYSYSEGDRIFVHLEHSKGKLVSINSIHSGTLEVTEEIRDERYTLTLTSKTTGTLTGVGTQFEATVGDIEPDPEAERQ